jgi:DNA polymerase III epsilon subunit-like protein
MNYRDIIVFDFETGSRNPMKTQPTQIAAIALHGRRLTPQPGGVFNSEIRPIIDDKKAIEAGFDPLEEEALEITGKNRKDLAKAPSPKAVWQKFEDFCNKFNFRGTSYTAPIAAGYNIIGFDLPIVQRMCEMHGTTDSRGRQTLFNPIFKLDVMDMVFSWTENNKEFKSLSMDFLREYMGFPEESKENAHDALQDVKDTANILIKFLKFQRNISQKTKFEKAFANGEFYV